MKFIRIIPLIILSLTAAGCNSGNYATFSGYAQGGVYTVKANLKGVATPRAEIAAAVDSLLEGIDFSISGYNRNSLLSRYNAGENIEPDRYFRELAELSEKYREMTRS